MRAHGSNEAVGGNLAEFNCLDQVWENSRHSVYPCERGEVARNLAADLVASLESAGERGWVPGDAGNDDVSVCLVDNVGVHPQCWEAFPFPIDAPLSSLLDPLKGLSMMNCGKLELEGRSRLPALKGVRGACSKSRD